MRETEILDQAINAFTLITGADLKITALEDRKTNADAHLLLNFKDKQQNFFAEVKNEIRSFQLPQIIQQFKDTSSNWMLLAQYIPSTIKSELKGRRINYLEASGNCYIETKDFYFYINDRKVTETRLVKEGKLWNPTGLKFLFALLADKGLLNANYRTVAAAAGIALGNVGPLLAELKEEGFLIQADPTKNAAYFLDNEQLLENRWIELYSSILKPKIRIGRFRWMQEKEDWQKINNKHIIWGGENAGAILTTHLRPEIFTIYTRLDKTNLMKDQKLIPDPKGKVEAISQFWSDDLQQAQEHRNVVPPIMAYAELATSMDSRNQETAERIKNQYLI
ncbi:type IV toxin-antitoxin system AbiEi family antitoxin [Mucilaginibacter corticis]|nr:type IV toxin-antitoxin system AbiEi family antitoxin [Mucilaginibacter corticis]